jgi:hypothetical protein
MKSNFKLGIPMMIVGCMLAFGLTISSADEAKAQNWPCWFDYVGGCDTGGHTGCGTCDTPPAEK